MPVPHNYVQISATGLFAGGGMYHMARDQLERFRAAVGDDRTGGELRGGDRVGPSGPPRHRRCRTAVGDRAAGWPKDHPRVELLRMKGLITLRDFGAPAWLHTKRVANEVAKAWRAGAAGHEWFATNVGPSEEPPRSR